MLTAAISAFLLGLLSSFHCVGMCGPLLLALPTRHLPPAARLLSPLVYHSGRITTYSLAGMLFGLLGRHIYLAGWQQGFSITLGAGILLIFLTRYLPLAAFTRLSLALGRRLTPLWRSPGTTTHFLLGMANGLLPCGMVYLAIAGALTRTTIAGSAAFMTLFGIGTLPLLLGTQYLGRTLSPAIRIRLRRTLPFVTIAMGILLILRGLNLGIPFISPALAASPGRPVSCH